MASPATCQSQAATVEFAMHGMEQYRHTYSRSIASYHVTKAGSASQSVVTKEQKECPVCLNIVMPNMNCLQMVCMWPCLHFTLLLCLHTDY